MSKHRAVRDQRRRHGRRRPAHQRLPGRRFRLLRTLLTLTLVLAIGAGAAAWYLYEEVRSIGSSSALDGGIRKSKDGATNILLMGLDSRKAQNGEEIPKKLLQKLHAGSSEIGGYNANTLILLRVPAGNGQVKGFSIPRDDLVDIPGHGQDKIKKAYGLAKAAQEQKLRQQGVDDKRELERAGREAGRRAQITTVSAFLDLPIDHFAELSLAGFYHLADAIDGVEVCLKNATSDRYSGADFPAGKQTLKAEQALAFVRQRHGLAMGDLDRTRRQQAFLASALHKVNRVGTLTNPGRLLKLKDVVKENVVLDKGWDLLSFLTQARNLSGGKVEFTTLPVEGFEKRNGEDVNVVDREKVRDLIKAQIAGPPEPSESSESSEPAGRSQPSGPANPAKSSTTEAKVKSGGIPCVH